MEKENKILKVAYGTDKTLLELGEIKVPAYVLENGQRVLSRNGMQKALGFEGTSGDWLTNFVKNRAMTPHISAGVLEAINNPVEFERIGAGGSASKTYAHEATLLVDICDAIIRAKNAGDLRANQLIYAKVADIVIRSVAKVGIIALVDEATGYQYEREKDELKIILKTLISDEILAYQQQFQLSFYKEIFRLWDIPFTPQNIRRKPQFIGHITNRYVYSNMPKGSFVLDELKKKTPKNDKGKYKLQFHRYLTDTGKETLKKVLYTVEAFASVSKTKREFDRLINEKYNQPELPFPDLQMLDRPPVPENVPKPKDTEFVKNIRKGLNWNPKDHK